jgi:hypothetical protein
MKPTRFPDDVWKIIMEDRFQLWCLDMQQLHMQESESFLCVLSDMDEEMMAMTWGGLGLEGVERFWAEEAHIMFGVAVSENDSTDGCFCIRQNCVEWSDRQRAMKAARAEKYGAYGISI